MKTNVPKCHSVNEINEYLKKRKTSEALEQELTISNLFTKAKESLSQACPTLYELSKNYYTKFPEVGSATKGKVFSKLVKLANDMYPDHVTLYSNDYFKISAPILDCSCSLKPSSSSKLFIENNHPYACGVIVRNRALHKGINQICIDENDKIVIDAGFILELEISFEHLNEPGEFIYERTFSVNILRDEFKNCIKNEYEISISPRDMPTVNVDSLQYFPQLKKMLRTKYPHCKRDAHLLYAAYWCQIPQMFEDYSSIYNSTVNEAVKILDIDYGIAEKYAYELMIFFCKVYGLDYKDSSILKEYRLLNDIESTIQKLLIERIINKIFRNKKMDFEYRQSIYTYSIVFENIYEIDFEELSLSVVCIADGVKIRHTTFYLHNLDSNSSEKQEIILPERMDTLILESYKYKLKD